MSEPHKVSAPDSPVDFYRRLQMAEGQLFIATELLKDVANSGIEDALNTKYMVIQIDRETWDAVQKYKVEGEQRAQTPDEPVFRSWEVVTGDINCRSDPETRLRLNTTMSWVVGPAHRSFMEATKDIPEEPQRVFKAAVNGCYNCYATGNVIDLDVVFCSKHAPEKDK